MDEHDFSQHFACYREKGDATTVATFCSVTLLLVYNNNVDIFPLLWETLSGQAIKDKMMQPSVISISTIVNDLSMDDVRTDRYVVSETENGLFNFVNGWWVIMFWDDRQIIKKAWVGSVDLV